MERKVEVDEPWREWWRGGEPWKGAGDELWRDRWRGMNHGEKGGQ